MGKWFRCSVRDLLMLTSLVAVSLTLMVQSWRNQQTEARHKVEIAQLQHRLHATQQILRDLPVDDPDRAYVLATPPFAYARWAWRVYLPKGRRYVLHVDVGNVVTNGSTKRIVASPGHFQQFGLRGSGETVVVVERFARGKRRLLGVSLEKHNTCCPLTATVSRCMDDRVRHQEEQLGTSGAAEIAGDDPVELLKRWYPSAKSTTEEPSAGGPPGFSVWLEPV